MKELKAHIPSSFMLITSMIFFISAFTMKDQSIFNPAGASFVPALITIIMFVCGLYTLKEERNFLRKIVAFEKVEKTNHTDILDEVPVPKDKLDLKDLRNVIVYFIMVLIFIFIMNYITFYISAFLFLVISMFYLKGVTWKQNLIVAITTITITYLLFNLLFKIVFP